MVARWRCRRLCHHLKADLESRSSAAASADWPPLIGSRKSYPKPELALFEAADRLGGVLQTVHRDGCLVEQAADSFITKTPWAVDLCRRLGLRTSFFRRTPPIAAHVRGACRQIAAGARGLRTNDAAPAVAARHHAGASWRGKLRLLAEPLVPNVAQFPTARPTRLSQRMKASRRLPRDDWVAKPSSESCSRSWSESTRPIPRS